MNNPTPPLTQDQKIKLYRAGRYQMKAPPVCHAQWDEAAWIRYVDLHGRWLPNTGK